MEKIKKLIEKGVKIISPHHTYIGDEVSIDNIHPTVEIYPFTRISGNSTSIGPGCKLGTEGPLTIIDSQLGEDVSISSGTIIKSVILDKVSIGPDCYIRPFSLLEEEVTCGHCVGLKQTILFPFVTLGSLINLCDCLVAGGTNRKNHTEIGSSYVHFNFSVHRDKATASLIGDVPRGVLLDKSPIFLGGQGGLVGPAKIEYGCVIGAGTICRTDLITPDTLFSSPQPKILKHPYIPQIYKNLDRILFNCFLYIGNILALIQWYKFIRELQTSSDKPWVKNCIKTAQQLLHEIYLERIRRIDEIAKNLEKPVKKGFNSKQQKLIKSFSKYWPQIKESLKNGITNGNNMAEEIVKRISLSSRSYIHTIQALDSDTKQKITEWLTSIVNSVLKITKPILK